MFYLKLPTSLFSSFAVLSMKTIYTILHKCLLIILAIQLLNLSFNNLNNFFSGQPESTISYHNQIDSAFEYVTEHLLGWDNYVPENKSRTDHQANHLHKVGSICLYVPYAPVEIVRDEFAPAQNYPVAIFSTTKGFEMEVNPPPPKA